MLQGVRKEVRNEEGQEVEDIVWKKKGAEQELV